MALLQQLKLGQRNDYAGIVLRLLPAGLLCRGVVVVESGRLYVEQLPPLLSILFMESFDGHTGRLVGVLLRYISCIQAFGMIASFY